MDDDLCTGFGNRIEAMRTTKVRLTAIYCNEPKEWFFGTILLLRKIRNVGDVEVVNNYQLGRMNEAKRFVQIDFEKITDKTQKSAMKRDITIDDFSFETYGYGRYRVTYKSPKTGKEYSNIITDMLVIDATKNADEPKKKDLEDLKRACKNGSFY